MRTLAVALLMLGPSTVEAAPEIVKNTVQSNGLERTYYLFVPEGAAGPRPLIVLLHGSGRNGRILLEHWRELAQKEGIVLAGPDAIDSQQWQFPADGPILLRDVVKDVQAKTTVDPRCVYLFGHSAGANFALPMALMQSHYFAAAAAHAGGLANGNEAAIDIALRKVPLALIIGVKDRAIGNARLSQELLTKAGFSSELHEIPRHGHDYYGKSKQINEMAWKFLSAHTLDVPPAYIPYANVPG